jgi:hypothetical protein
VHFDGINTALGSLTLGAQYFLSTTPGVGVATTPPSASGNIVQRLGKAISLTEIESDLGNVGILVA